MFNNNVVLVTGGANGIGREIVKTFSKHGAHVIFIDIDDENGKALEKEVNSSFYYHCDLRNEEEVHTLFVWMKKRFKRCDILINNAGVSQFKSIFEISVKEFDDVLNINLRGAFLMSREFALMNRGCDYGRIINIASTRYLMSEKDSEAYAASKGGMVSLTHALALSLENENITVNSISPGWIETKSYEALLDADHLQHRSN